MHGALHAQANSEQAQDGCVRLSLHSSSCERACTVGGRMHCYEAHELLGGDWQHGFERLERVRGACSLHACHRAAGRCRRAPLGAALILKER